MKQGPSHNSYSPKREPISKAVNPGGVAQLGAHVGTARAVEPLYKGRGYEAPLSKSFTHPSGSQGKR